MSQALTPPQNKALDVVDAIIKGLIYNVGVEAAIIAATLQFPFLGYPIIRGLFRWLVDNIAGKVFAALAPYVDYQIIKFQDESQRTAYEMAIAELKAAHEKGDTNETNKALERAKAALDHLISYNH